MTQLQQAIQELINVLVIYNRYEAPIEKKDYIEEFICYLEKSLLFEKSQ